jgi:demethoxyubiquinone hydroxylase (CLK1/Coq7/Cat5 family)
LAIWLGPENHVVIPAYLSFRGVLGALCDISVVDHVTQVIERHLQKAMGKLKLRDGDFRAVCNQRENPPRHHLNLANAHASRLLSVTQGMKAQGVLMRSAVSRVSFAIMGAT